MRLDYFQDQEITLTLKLNGISNPNHRHNPEKAERVFCVSGFVCFLVYVEWSNFRMNPWIWRWDEQQHFRKNRRKLIEIEIFRILRLVRPLILILLTARKKDKITQTVRSRHIVEYTQWLWKATEQSSVTIQM